MTDEDDSLLELAAEIVRNSRVGSFPEDYILNENAEKIEIPTGTDILMFRQDENVVVSIDGKRIYLRAYDEAKYIFYSAKRGQRYLQNPAGLELRDAIRKFEEDLDDTQSMIDRAASGMKGDLRNRLGVECSRLLGYFDIF